MEESLFCQLLEDYISEGKKMAAMEITQQVLTGQSIPYVLEYAIGDHSL